MVLATAYLNYDILLDLKIDDLFFKQAIATNLNLRVGSTRLTLHCQTMRAMSNIKIVNKIVRF